MNKPLVSIIIVNWNGENVIGECLSSLFAQNYKNIEVIVVDNNSFDSSKKIIKKFEKVKFIENEKNKGFAAGNNIGFKKASGKYILLLNNDTEVSKEFLDPLVRVLEENENIVVVQPKILFKKSHFYTDGRINSIGSFFTSSGILYHIGYGKLDMPVYNKSFKIFTAHGSCMLLRKNHAQKIGLFDPDFFAYFEETDFCLRVWLSGGEIIYIPDSIVYHKGGVSARKYGNKQVIFHSFKNRICCYLKNFETLTLLRILPVQILLCEFQAFLYLLFGNINGFFSVQKAFMWNIRNFNDTLNKRKIVQQTIRKVKDKTFLKEVEKNPRILYYLYFLKGLEYYKD
ncbi:MAG: glycosyltransferase family 2 protein [Candidatus Levybacteria bacterium]|nr:glycosyltransferase family 2 protein [Candidatus Levybacteria bacterium]